MKKQLAILLLAGGMLSGTATVAQKVKTAPPAVLSALKAKYPQATKITWEKEKGNFEANWGGKSGEDMSVTFTPAGAFVEQVEAITTAQLPQAAQTYVKAHYKGAKISEAGKVTDAAGKISYEAEVKGKDLVFDDKGAFLKAEKE
ncbi:MAG TPA: PepSY-like domain-containing protein [Mucilaginibacter sp.]|jgi:hypothetical protein|nr:PepSY-like domain-containing protein [Mucilaginibacter sp.]